MKKHNYKTDSGNEMETRRVGLHNLGKEISPCSFVIWSPLSVKLFHGIYLYVSLTLQVLSDVCKVSCFITEWDEIQESERSLLQTILLGFLALQVLNLLSLCEPGPSSGEGGLDPCTPSSVYPSHPCSGLVFGSCVLGSSTHWRDTFLHIPFPVKSQGHRMELPVVFCS